MRVILTGGTGLIGQALSRSLVGDHHEVIVLSRNPEKYRAELPAGVQVQGWDARTAKGWGQFVEGAEAIVNLAGVNIAGDSLNDLVLKRLTPKRRQSILKSRLNAGQAVTEAVTAARQKPAVVIQASAVGYYGSRGDEILTEESAPGTDFIAEIVQAWENSTTEVEALGVRRAIIRTAASALSLEGGSFPFMLLPFRFFAGGPLGSGKQWFPWIHILDEVRAIRFLIDNPQASGPFNLCSPQTLRNRDFNAIVGRVMRRPAFIPTPALALRLAFGQKAEILLASQRQVPARLQALGFDWRFPTAESALKDLLA